MRSHNVETIGRPHTIESACQIAWKVDAHATTYVLFRKDSPKPVAKAPRLRIVIPDGWLESEGYIAKHFALFVDIDNPGHEPHTPASLARLRQFWESRPGFLKSAGMYSTNNGWRCVQRLNKPVDGETWHRTVLTLIAELRACGCEPDTTATEWSRYFRLPRVRRAGVDVEPALFDLANMQTRFVPPQPVQARTIPKRKKRPARPRPAVVTSLPDDWKPHALRIADALTGRAGTTHSTAMRLAGALCDRIDAADQGNIPALVHDAARLANWHDLPDALAAASSTIDVAARGLPYQSHVDPRITIAIDACFDRRPDQGVSADQATLDLKAAIAGAPHGVTAIRAECGLGKTYATIAVAAERGDKRTVISVPTNRLAREVAADARKAGQRVLRVFGPGGERNEDGTHVCAFPRYASAVATAGASVATELCRYCEHRETCDAADGMEGDTDAPVVVTNHAMIGYAQKRAGTTGLLVIDEPPATHETHLWSAWDLTTAIQGCRYFPHATLDTALEATKDLILFHDPGTVIGIPSSGHTSEHAIELKSSAVDFRLNRSDLKKTELIQQAGVILKAFRRAILEPSAEVTVATKIEGDRAVPALRVVLQNERLAEALRRDGRTVIAGADVHLHLNNLARLAGEEPHLLEFGAADSCAVRRVHINANASITKLRAGLGKGLATAWRPFATGRTVFVTFKTLLDEWRQHLPDNAELVHYAAVRGLNTWADADTIVTLGDPRPNLGDVGAISGPNVDAFRAADALARAVLEQAHGRLRTKRRTKPATMVHIGRLVPAGWRDPIETHEHKGGRPAASIDVLALVREHGSLAAAARAIGVSRRTLTTKKKVLNDFNA